MPVETQADLKRTVEIAALAVRELKCKESGLYCKIYYGGVKRKLKKLRKESGGEWKLKHPITLTTPGPSDLVIECWKKHNCNMLKKFHGRISISSSQLENTDQIKGWHDLGSRGKDSEVISGKLYIRAIFPSRPKSLNQCVDEQRSRRREVLPVPPQPGIVFDRTDELRGTLQQQKAAVSFTEQKEEQMRGNVPQPQQQQQHKPLTVQKHRISLHRKEQHVTHPKSENNNNKDQHQLRIEIVSNLIRASEKELLVLQEKTNQFERSKDQAFTRMEIEDIVRGLKDSIQLGMTTLREVGEALNHNWSEHELRIKMQQSNYLLHRFTLVVDELNSAQKQLKERNIM